jgi:hypothetical protein
MVFLRWNNQDEILKAPELNRPAWSSTVGSGVDLLQCSPMLSYEGSAGAE